MCARVAHDVHVLKARWDVVARAVVTAVLVGLGARAGGLVAGVVRHGPCGVGGGGQASGPRTSAATSTPNAPSRRSSSQRQRSPIASSTVSLHATNRGGDVLDACPHHPHVHRCYNAV